MNVWNYLTDNWELITGTGGLSGFFAYIFGSKRRKIDDKSAELENLKEVRKIEKQIVMDAKQNVKELIELNDTLSNMLKEKDMIIEQKNRIITEQKQVIQKQEKSLNYYKKKHLE